MAQKRDPLAGDTATITVTLGKEEVALLREARDHILERTSRHASASALIRHAIRHASFSRMEYLGS